MRCGSLQARFRDSPRFFFTRAAVGALQPLIKSVGKALAPLHTSDCVKPFYTSSCDDTLG